MADSYVESLLGKEEHILLVTHQHWFALFSKIFLEIVLILALVVGVIIAMAYYPMAVYGFILVLVPFLGMLKDILVWRNHQYIVTNRRVMQTSGVFSKEVLDSSLEKVNDIEMNQSFFGRLFGYGNLQILTASELGVDSFKKISNPIEFKKAILNAREDLRIDENEFQQQREDDIPTLIAKLDDLRKRGIISEEEFREKKADLLAKM